MSGAGQVLEAISLTQQALEQVTARDAILSLCQSQMAAVLHSNLSAMFLDQGNIDASINHAEAAIQQVGQH